MANNNKTTTRNRRETRQHKGQCRFTAADTSISIPGLNGQYLPLAGHFPNRPRDRQEWERTEEPSSSLIYMTIPGLSIQIVIHFLAQRPKAREKRICHFGWLWFGMAPNQGAEACAQSPEIAKWILDLLSPPLVWLDCRHIIHIAMDLPWNEEKEEYSWLSWSKHGNKKYSNRTATFARNLLYGHASAQPGYCLYTLSERGKPDTLSLPVLATVVCWLDRCTARHAYSAEHGQNKPEQTQAENFPLSSVLSILSIHCRGLNSLSLDWFQVDELETLSHGWTPGQQGKSFRPAAGVVAKSVSYDPSHEISQAQALKPRRATRMFMFLGFFFVIVIIISNCSLFQAVLECT